MDNSNRIQSVSVAQTVPRQTQGQSFGEQLSRTLQTVGQAGTALIGALPGGAVLSAAVSGLTRAASAGGVGGVTTVTGLTGTPTGVPDDLGGMVSQMRAEADRSLAMQMEMQNESRQYNALSNVIKVRHDSAKAAINNLR